MDIVVYVSVSGEMLGRAGWKGQLRPESRQKQRETNKWKRIQAAYIHNDAEDKSPGDDPT